jgi:hypothetical protein
MTIDQQQRRCEVSEPKISVVGSVTPEQEGAEHNVEFSELVRPPAYEGKMTLRIRPKEIRVWRLPAVELDQNDRLETVVRLQYRVEEKENGLKSTFEIR